MPGVPHGPRSCPALSCIPGSHTSTPAEPHVSLSPQMARASPLTGLHRAARSLPRWVRSSPDLLTPLGSKGRGSKQAWWPSGHDVRLQHLLRGTRARPQGCRQPRACVSGACPAAMCPQESPWHPGPWPCHANGLVSESEGVWQGDRVSGGAAGEEPLAEL